MDNKTAIYLKTTRWIDFVFYTLAFSFIGYQMYYIKANLTELSVHAIIHLGFAMALCSWHKLRSRTHSLKSLIYIITIFICSLAVTAYFFFSYKAILNNPSHPPLIALVFGVIAAVISAILVRWSYGWLFPIFCIIAFLYVLFGNHIPGMFRGPSVSLQRTITLLVTDVTSPWGLYGDLLGLSANYLFLFIIFGSILHAFGGLRFIIQIGNLIASKLRSGPAALAVVSSALLGL